MNKKIEFAIIILLFLFQVFIFWQIMKDYDCELQKTEDCHVIFLLKIVPGLNGVLSLPLSGGIFFCLIYIFGIAFDKIFLINEEEKERWAKFLLKGVEDDTLPYPKG